MRNFGIFLVSLFFLVVAIIAIGIAIMDLR
jgi:hypothetical protein